MSAPNTQTDCHTVTSIFRYLVVCHAAALVGQEKSVGQRIQNLSLYISLGIGLASFPYRENCYIFLACIGKMELFVLDLENPFLPFVGGEIMKLSLLNPFRFCANVVGFSFIVIVPTLYFLIFQCRLYQDTRVQGDDERNAHKSFVINFPLFRNL